MEMDQLKDLTLLSCVDKKVSLRFKEVKKSLQVDVKHLLNQTPYQKTTETVMEGIPNVIETRVTKHAQHSNALDFSRQKINKIPQSVPPIGQTSLVDDKTEDEEKEDKKQKEVLIDVGDHVGPDSFGEQLFAKVGLYIQRSLNPSELIYFNGQICFQWKALASLLIVIGTIAVCLWSGNMFRTDVNTDIPLGPAKNRMKLGQSVDVIPHQKTYINRIDEGFSHEANAASDQTQVIFFLRTRRQSEIFYPVKTFRALKEGESCPTEKNLQCDEDERAVCIRNITWKNLMVVCVKNISITYGCPVFTTARKSTHQFPFVQLDKNWNCSVCPQYGLWDVENFHECLILDTPTTTSDATAVTTNSAVKEKQAAKGLSDGSIVAIFLGGIFLLVVILILVLYKLGHLKKLRMLKERICRSSRWIPVRQ